MTSESAAAARQTLIGHSVDDRYWLEAEIGVGGLGSVYRAVQTKLQRPVAVKLLHESCGATSVQRRRFEREARALAVLEHPNIVAVLDYGVEEERPYLVMELLEGETLAQRVKRGPLALERALSITQQLLSALGFMHAAQLVHRDVKPSNVFLQRLRGGRERVKVLDFGLAKFTTTELPDADATLTRDGTIVGTPAYMSPEQATGELVDARSDVYAVGVILFQMLSGRLPFEGDAIEQVRSHLVSPVPALNRVPAERQLDALLQDLIEHAMAKRREDRFVDGNEMLQAMLKSFPSLLHAEMLAGSSAEESWPNSDDTASVDDPDEMMTSFREPRTSLLVRLRDGLRTLLMTGVRLVAAVSTLIVLTLVAIIALLSRNATDRADLNTLKERVSDRLIQRPLIEPEPIAKTRDERRTEPAARAQTAPPQSAEARQPVPPRLLGPDVEIPYASPASPHLVASAGAIAGSARTEADARPDHPAPSAPARPGSIPTSLAPTASSTTSLNAATSGAANLKTAGSVALPPVAAGRPIDPAADQSGAKALTDPVAGARAVLPPPQLAAASPALNVPGPPPAHDPWANPPKELRGIRRFISIGGAGSEKTVIALRTYSQEHPTDPRGHILLGQLYFNRAWRSDSVAQFATALQLDLSARGSPEILPTLIGIVVHDGKGASDAEQLITRAYGSEAVPMIDAILGNTRDQAAAQRLRGMRGRLEGRAGFAQARGD